MSDLALRLAPRSGVADADLALLQIARTNLDELAHAAPVTLADRLRGLSPFRSRRAKGPVAGSRPGRSRG